MKKQIKKLDLNKLVISKLNNLGYIQGGETTNVCVTTKTNNPEDPICITTSLTCPESFYHTCGPTCENNGGGDPISGMGC